MISNPFCSHYVTWIKLPIAHLNPFTAWLPFLSLLCKTFDWINRNSKKAAILKKSFKKASKCDFYQIKQMRKIWIEISRIGFQKSNQIRDNRISPEEDISSTLGPKLTLCKLYGHKSQDFTQKKMRETEVKRKKMRPILFKSE